MEKRSKLYAWYDMMLFYLTLPEVDMHNHHPMQITIALDDAFELKLNNGGWKEYQMALTGPDVRHALRLKEGHAIVLQIFPETEAGHALQKGVLGTQKNTSYPIKEIDEFLPKLKGIGQAKYTLNQVRELCQELIDTILGDHYIIGFDKSIDQRIRKAIELIRSLPKKKISLENMAERVHLSPSRFRHLFKEETGITFRKMLMQMRLVEVLKHAKDEQSLTRLAYETGFSDLAHLSSAFKRVGGTSPSSYINSRQFLEVFTEND